MKPTKLVKAILKTKKMTQKDMAEYLGVSQSSISRWNNDNINDMTAKHVAALEELAIRHGLISGDDHNKAAMLLGGVRELDARAGAGGGGVGGILNTTHGHLIISEDMLRSDVWLVPDAFLREQIRLTPERALVIEVVGDSGYDPANPHQPGSLFSGNRVFVDTADRDPTQPGMFAIYDGTGIVIKVVSVVRGSDPLTYRLASRNPSYPPYEVLADEARVIGRIKAIVSQA